MSKNIQSIYPKISIVTPSLNQGQFIEATIQSVLSQEYPNLEYLVVDGGSSDDTLDILRSYVGSLKWISEKDKGQTDAINKGLNLASGEILAYLNADDVLLPGTLFKVAGIFSKYPDVMWLTGRCRIVDEQGSEVRRLITIYKNILLSLHSSSLLLMTDYISQPSTFFRADAYRQLGKFDENLHYAMDYEYWLRMNSVYRLQITPEYLSSFRVHLFSKNTNVGYKQEYIDEERDIIQKYTNSKMLLFLHNLHRWFMTTIYKLLNSR